MKMFTILWRGKRDQQRQTEHEKTLTVLEGAVLSHIAGGASTSGGERSSSSVAGRFKSANGGATRSGTR